MGQLVVSAREYKLAKAIFSEKQVEAAKKKSFAGGLPGQSLQNNRRVFSKRDLSGLLWLRYQGRGGDLHRNRHGWAAGFQNTHF